MKKQIFRFAVGSSDDVRSWIWRVWVNKNDVYLGTKNSLQVFKVSLHQSGVWRIAFVKELQQKDSLSDRVIVRWNRPNEFAPGWTPSIGVLISSILPQQPFSSRLVFDSRISWIPFPSQGKRLLFKVLFSDSTRTVRSVLMPSDKVLTQIVKANGEIVWLIVREERITEIEALKVRDVMEKTKIHIKPAATADSIHDSRALLVVSEEQPSISTQPTIIDIPLGIENLERDG